MTVTLSGPMLPPRSGETRRIVVLFHGYGSDGNDLIALGQYWRELLPDTLFVAPNAPEPCPGNPLGFQWFALDAERATARLEGVVAARPVIKAFLEALWAQTGLSGAETVLSGFSQGAMMALNTGLSLDDALMGIVAFSGAFVPPENFGPASPKPPVCLVHGDRDEVVDAAFSAAAERELAAMGIEVRHHVSRGTGHGIAPDGLAFALDFIAGLAADR